MGLKFEDSALKGAGAYDEVRKHEAWADRAKGMAFLAFVVALLAAYPLSHLIFGAAAHAPNSSPLHLVLDLRYVFAGEVGIEAWAYHYLGRWFLTFWHFPPFGVVKVPPTLLLPLLLPWLVQRAISKRNPFSKTPNIYGDTRWAKLEDIVEMGRRKLVGFASGTDQPCELFVVGKFKDRLLKLGETLSVLILAPPGTGKSVGFVVPSIVELDRSSMFVHDMKPELWDMTSGYRQKLGPCIKLMWSAEDCPEGKWITPEEARLTPPSLLERDERGEPVKNGNGEFRTRPIFYPSWNPLSPKTLPVPGGRRDMYLERLVNVLCPDPKSGSDKFWTSRARAALIGLAHYLVAKVDAASDPEITDVTWDGIPEWWVGREASFPMLVDWYAAISGGSGTREVAGDPNADPIANALRNAIDECKTLDEVFGRKYGSRGLLARAITEITSLMNTPDRTRGSITATMDDGLAPFKIEAVRQRTSSCDFSFKDLRGMPTAAAAAREAARVEEEARRGVAYKPRYARNEWQPVTVYACVALEDARAMAGITAIFVDAANAYLVANGPNAIDDQGNQVGPFDFTFILDECPQLPKLDTVMNGPATGRSKRISYAIIGQSFGQFEQQYSKADVETLKSTTSVKIILSQNDEASARAIAAAAGKATVKKFSLNEKEKNPLSKFLPKGPTTLFDDKSGKRWSESWEAVEFLKPSFLMSLPDRKHVVLVQNFMSRPILATTPRFFDETRPYDVPTRWQKVRARVLGRKLPQPRMPIAAKVFNLFNGAGPTPAPPMPAEWAEAAAARRVGRAEQEAAAKERRQALTEPRHVLVITPSDMRSLSLGSGSEPAIADENLQYVCWATNITEMQTCVSEPEVGDVLITPTIDEVATMVGYHRLVVFDHATFEREINAPLEAMGKPTIDPSQVVSLKQAYLELEEVVGEDLYQLGAHGPAVLTLPNNPEQITPHYCMAWLAETLTHVLGVRFMQMTFDSWDAEAPGEAADSAT